MAVHEPLEPAVAVEVEQIDDLVPELAARYASERAAPLPDGASSRVPCDDSLVSQQVSSLGGARAVSPSTAS